jgi:hypothetical protein
MTGGGGTGTGGSLGAVSGLAAQEALKRINAMNNLREAITDGIAKLTGANPAQLGASLGGLLGGQLGSMLGGVAGLSAEAAAQAVNMAAAGLTAATGAVSEVAQTLGQVADSASSLGLS